MDYDRVNKIIASVQSETDRGCVIIASSNVEYELKRTLSQALIANIPKKTSKDIFSGTGPLSTFSGNINIAYALGLISWNIARELHLIRKIRNAFAHDPDYELGFTNQEIGNFIRELKIPTKSLSEVLTGENDTTRARFEWTTTMLVLFLQCKKEHTSRPTVKPEKIDVKVKSRKPFSVDINLICG